MDGRKNNGAKKGENRGQGRKPVHNELEARDLSIEAIKTHYGGVKEGMVALLQSGESALIKFVFEHAVGKPTDKVQHSADPDSPVIFKMDARFTEPDNS